MRAFAVISGEPGIGKSRLLREFGASVARTGATVVSGAPPFSAGLDLPFAPWWVSSESRGKSSRTPLTSSSRVNQNSDD